MRLRRDVSSVPLRSASETWQQIIDLVTGTGSKDIQQLKRATGVMGSIITDERPATRAIMLEGVGAQLRIYCRYGMKAVEEGAKVDSLGFVSTPLDDAVERRVTMLMYFTTLSVCGIEFRPIPKLAGTQILRDMADTLPNEVPAEAKRPTFRSYAAQRNMNMGVLRIEVSRCHPFEACTKIGLHL